GVVWHLLLPVGEGWGAGEVSRFGVPILKERIDHINSEGGAVTLDVQVTADGRMPPGILQVLRELGQDGAKLRDGIRSY
ncbi:MAG: hypothetical protein VX633_01245, partial [Verrucomicrobiota bacterium]|nr:hypothetical protein [Verrucomicrobiota bacterium]